MLGEGIVSFGVWVTTDFKNLKASTKMGLGRVTRLVIARSGRGKWRSPPWPWNVTGIVWPWLDQPSSWSRKSMCHDLRRCSPSVMPCSPTSSWSFTTSRMEASSAAASLSAPTRPASFSSLSALSAAGRRRLPTWSARNGPRAAAVISLFEVTAEEGEHLLPRVPGLRGTVALGVREVQEGVAGALVAVELVRLGRRPRPREQVGDAPSHAKAEHREVGDARVLERAQVRDGSVRVGEDLRVAQPPDARHHVGAVLGLAVIEIRRCRGVAVAGEVVDAALDELVEAGAVHDDDDAGRLRGAGRAPRVDAHQGLPFVSSAL